MKCSKGKGGVDGFTLVELMLVISVGMLFVAIALGVITRDLSIGQAMAQRLRERGLQQRTLMLIKADLARSYGWLVDPPISNLWPCSLAGRQPVLAIATAPDDPEARRRAIIYSVGSSPSPIWRSQVLMRCGPAFEINGEPNLVGNFQNRVLIDGLPASLSHGELGFVARPDPRLPVLRLELEQQFQLPNGKMQRIRSAASA